MVLKVGGGCHNAGLVFFIEWEQVDEKINEIKEKVEMKAYLLLLRSAMEQCLSVLSIIQLIASRAVTITHPLFPPLPDGKVLGSSSSVARESQASSSPVADSVCLI